MTLRAVVVAAAAICLATCCALTARAEPIDCPLIRPPGLAASDVDRIVLARVAQSLGRAPGTIDRDKTFKALQGDQAAFAVFIVTSGEALGFDSAEVFHEAARRKGGASAYEALTVREYQDLSRAEYSQGKDSPPPVAEEGREYPLHRISVRAPSPAAGWLVMQCTHERVVFQRLEPGIGATTVMAHLLDLSFAPSERELLEHTRKQVTEVFDARTKLQSLEVRSAPGAAGRCSQINAVAEMSGFPYLVRGRYCRGATSSAVAYGVLYGHMGSGDARRFAAEATAYIDSVIK